MRSLFIAFATLIVTATTSLSAAADWTLDPANSRLYFASIKAGDVAEGHRFEKLSGRVSADGKVLVEVALNSVETGVDIRNTRMKEHLFNTAKFPLATVTAEIDLKVMAATPVGDARVLVLPINVALAGGSADYEIELKVARLGAKRVSIQTLSPVLVHADDFDLMGGINKLRELAGLDAINPVVPVTLTAEFADK